MVCVGHAVRRARYRRSPGHSSRLVRAATARGARTAHRVRDDQADGYRPVRTCPTRGASLPPKRNWLVEAPSLDHELGTFTRSGGPAPSLHQICARGLRRNGTSYLRSRAQRARGVWVVDGRVSSSRVRLSESKGWRGRTAGDQVREGTRCGEHRLSGGG